MRNGEVIFIDYFPGRVYKPCQGTSGTFRMSLTQALKLSPECVGGNVLFGGLMLVRMFQRKIRILMPVFLTMCVLLASHAYAQTSGATLSGTVSDQSGGVVPQAAVSIKNVATGIERAKICCLEPMR